MHALLRERGDEIVRGWEALGAADRGPPNVGGSVLRARLREVLEGLADWLEADEAPRAERLRTSVLGAAASLEHPFELAHLVHELGLLRTAILRALFEPPPGTARAPALAGADLARLNAGLDVAISDAVEHFVAAREQRIAALHAAERRYTELVQLSPEAILVQRRGRIEYANPAAVELFGAASERDLVGKTPFDLSRPEHHEVISSWVQRLLRGELRMSPLVEVRIVRLDGAERHVEASAAICDDRNGRAIQVVMRDVTERKRAEAAVLEADRRKTEFLAVLSHELRNPLAPIRNSVELLDRAPPGGPLALRAREVIRRQADHLTSLVDDLLDMSRIDHGKITLERARVDAREVIRRACDDLLATFEERGVLLRRAFAPEPLWVDADPTRLAQIVTNLLTNAAKFTPRAGTVDVTLARAGDRCELRVRDTGAGIEPELLERIFEPFTQAERTRATARGGMGIGLSLVKSLVELHGGTVRAASEGLGRGAELLVSLPLAAARAEAPPLPAPAPASGLDVLIVEDNPDAGASLADLLELQGHRPRVALDGASAIAAFATSRPDVLVCDVGLPDIDGHEVVRRVRRLEGGRAVFAIALTGYAQPEDVQRALEAGFDAHLAKPPVLERLEALMAKAGTHRREDACRT